VEDVVFTLSDSIRMCYCYGSFWHKRRRACMYRNWGTL